MLIAAIVLGSVVAYALCGATLFAVCSRRGEHVADAVAVGAVWPFYLFVAVVFRPLFKWLARFGMWATEPRVKKSNATIPTAKVVQK